MARFFGKSSVYLIWNDLKYYTLAALAVIFPLAVLSVVLKYFSSLAILAAALVLALYAAVFSRPLVNLFAGKSRKFYHGWAGEWDIRRELKKLSDDFCVFQDLEIGKNKGNLDFVVAGPSGLFLLEVKSHRGNIDYDGQNLVINGRLFSDKDFLRQVHGQTFALKNYLKQQTGADFYIHSVLVFSSNYARLHSGLQPIENIYVIQKDFLLNLLTGIPSCKYPVPRKNVETILRDICR